MSESPLRWQDEILEVMYWIRGEKLGTQVSADRLNRFIKLQPPDLETALRRLIERKLLHFFIASGGGQLFELTERGIEEGKRRFIDEFSPFPGKETHLSCSDPNCDCRSPGWSGVCPSIGEQQ